MYTKLGDAGNYASYLVLIPDFGAGFSVMQGSGIATAAQRSAATRLLADLVSETLIPALQAQASAEAAARFQGTYEVAGGNASSSSSLTLVYNETAGNGYGLTITEFVSEGYDYKSLLSLSWGSDQLTLQHSISSRGKVAFQLNSVAPALPGDSFTGLFSKQFAVNGDWASNSGPTYGSRSLGALEFDVGDDGVVTGVTPIALKKKFLKK
ncbi:hypothetical protein F5Y15DRAFT_61926 [Xylariaceae sp. FL0016]|nr:hypothetical protein F5Y15DRAFT_61926 [Xylariaceae sp. FL0016]